MSSRFAVLVVAVGCAAGADSSQWSAVRDLKKGDRVGLVQSDMKRVEGRFDGASDDAITVDGNTVSKDRVVRVYRRPGMNRVVRAVVGAGIGAAAGAVADGTAGTRFRNEGTGPALGLITGLSAAGGAGIGAASGGGYKTVYQRK
jgi:hypothetical protein